MKTADDIFDEMLRNECRKAINPPTGVTSMDDNREISCWHCLRRFGDTALERVTWRGKERKLCVDCASQLDKWLNPDHPTKATTES